jgi:3-methyladenine DNA glycosylase AlkD
MVAAPRPEAARVRRVVRELARPVGAFDPCRYFRAADNLGFYNVGMPRVRALARRIHAEVRDDWSVADAEAFADILIRDRYFEVKAVGILVLARYRRAFTPDRLTAWHRWLRDGHAANWATTDSICGFLVGPLLLAHPGLAARVASWRRDRHLWVRRASAVGLIKLVASGRALDLAYRVAQDLHRDPEDLIQKAVGWLLREAGRTDPARLESYLRANGPRVPRATLRYAIEHFPPPKRRALLAATR